MARPLVSFGRQLGSRRLRGAAIYALNPLNFWRALELSWVLERGVADGSFRPGAEILDLSSPELLAIYLAQQGCVVTKTDLIDNPLAQTEVGREVMHIPPARLRIAIEDGCALSFPDESFDAVYSVSVVEHIGAIGDSTCMTELARVLRPRGSAYVTVPFAPDGYDVTMPRAGVEWAPDSAPDARGEVFFQHNYSEEDLRRRLIDPSGLSVESIEYVGQRVPLPGDRRVESLMNRWTGPVQPLLSRICLTSPRPDWRRLRQPLAAFLSLRRAG